MLDLGNAPSTRECALKIPSWNPWKSTAGADECPFSFLKLANNFKSTGKNAHWLIHYLWNSFSALLNRAGHTRQLTPFSSPSSIALLLNFCNFSFYFNVSLKLFSVVALLLDAMLTNVASPALPDFSLYSQPTVVPTLLGFISLSTGARRGMLCNSVYLYGWTWIIVIFNI